MKFLTGILVSISLFALSHSVVEAFPRNGKLIVPPLPQSYIGLKNIPDDEHPYREPGIHDQRGPCPGLNTLANHGYLPRNGVVSFEELVNAFQEGYNMDYSFASAIAAFAMLTRGNAFVNQVSIGGPTVSIPPLPNKLDGNVTKGLATHGRFEGDVSMTRYDSAIGDSVNFSQTLFDVLLDNVAKYGEDSDVTGPKSVVTWKALGEFKHQRFLQSQAENPTLEYHYGRLLLSYSESSFTMYFFANGTDEKLSIPIATSFLRDQMFPPNWSRRVNPGTFELIERGAIRIRNINAVSPGQNVDGMYVPDTEEPNDCSLYATIGSMNLPRSLVNTTGVLKDNVDTLLKSIHNLFPQCEFLLPVGEPGV